MAPQLANLLIFRVPALTLPLWQLHWQNSPTPQSWDSQQETSNMDFLLSQKKSGEEKDGDGERNGVSGENDTCPNGKGQNQ